MFNMCILTGHLTKDLEAKDVVTKKGNNKQVMNGTIAVNDGNSQYPDYINFTAWEKNAEVIQSYTTKGSLITLRGKWKKNKSEDKDGKTNYFDYLLVEDVKLLESKDKTDDRRASNEYIDNPFENSDKTSIYDEAFNRNIEE